MKKLVILLLALSFLFAACGPRPQYKTMEGKKKLKHYNQLQFGGI